MSDNLLVYNSFKYNVVIMKICAIYPPDGWPSWLYKLYAYFSYATITVLFPLLAAIDLFTVEVLDVHQACWNVILTVQTAALIVKAFVFVFYPQRVKRTREGLAKGIFVRHALDKDIEGAIQEYKAIFITISAFSVVSFLAYILTTAFGTERKFPVDVWLPFDGLADDWVYVGVFIYVTLGNAHGCFQNLSLDSMIVGMIFQSAAQLRILKNSLKFLGQNVEKEIKNQREFSDPENELRSKLVYRNICMCIDHYESIFEYTKDIEDVYSMVIFSQLFSSITIICILLLELSLVVPFTFKFFSTIIFALTMLIQIFLYCYYGSLLREESATINSAIYMSEWYKYDKKSKDILITLMERAKKPIKITAGKFFELSLDTFTSILRRSYSLLAVLKNYY